jgi:hypothetical protein
MQIFYEIGIGNIRRDLIRGIIIADIFLPLAVIFGMVSGAGAEASLSRSPTA